MYVQPRVFRFASSQSKTMCETLLFRRGQRLISEENDMPMGDLFSVNFRALWCQPRIADLSEPAL